MSHRLTMETKITDRSVAEDALRKANIAFDTRGDNIYLKSGAYTGTEINLKTGKITSGDTDYHKIDQGKLGLLRQMYAEAKYRAECLREGVTITDRREETVNGQKVIVLTCQTA